MRLVVVESPYKGNMFQRWLNRRYARACIRDCLLRRESPLASHLLYTQRGVLRDWLPQERATGINAGLAWAKHADLMVVYIDRGVSNGMTSAEMYANNIGLPVEYRSLTKMADLTDNPERVKSTENLPV